MEKFIKNLALGAGKILREGFQTKFKISHKSTPYDLVTEYDILVEKFLINRISKKFPKHGIMSEEGGSFGKRDKFWIIDPIDGTHAFVKGSPQFSTTFSYVERGKIKHGVIYDPINDELFYAEENQGARLNNRKVTVSSADSLTRGNLSSYVASHLADKQRKQLQRLIFNQLTTKFNMWADSTSSIALTGGYTAAARSDVLIGVGFNPWDISACGLIIKEAGGTVTEFDGGPYKWNSTSLVAANPTLHKKVMMELINFRP